MPWWGWVILGCFGLVGLLILAARGFRKNARRDFIAYLKQSDPEVEILEERDAWISFRSPKLGDGQIFLARLYSALTSVKANDPNARRAVFERFVKVRTEGVEALESLTVARFGDKILPRLVTSDYFSGLPEKLTVPSRPLDNTGLHVVYVLDLENSVAYISRDHQKDLGLDDAALHLLALTNLRKLFPRSVVRSTVENGSITTVIGPDTYEAARLVLVPEYLEDGEELIAIIPDRDTLVLITPPPDGDYLPIERLARANRQSEHPLLDRPVRVTRQGVALAAAERPNGT